MDKDLLHRAKYIRDKFKKLNIGSHSVYSSRYNIEETLKELGIYKEGKPVEEYHKELDEIIRNSK